MKRTIESIDVSLDTPVHGWSAIRIGDEASIRLSYVQDVPYLVEEAALNWLADLDGHVEFDGEDETWDMHLPAGDGTVSLTDPDGDPCATSIPTKVMLLQLVDGMLSDARGWAIWSSTFDDALEPDAPLEAWNHHIDGKADELARSLKELRDRLAAA